MKITDIKATTATVPPDAPLRHANGCHWGRFVRTVIDSVLNAMRLCADKIEL